MVAVRAADAARRFRTPDALPPVILVHGPDHGLVAETAAALAAVSDAGGDGMGLVRLDASEVAADPGRIADEARAISMFGGRRTVWVREVGGKDLTSTLAPLLEDPPEGATVIVEAGDLRKSAPLRKAVEAHRAAAAIGCYADSERDIERLVEEEARRFGLAVEDDARALLVPLLGGDRGATRSEIEKLMLYARGAPAVTVRHVRAIVGDVAAHDPFGAIDAAFLGDGATLLRELSALAAARVDPGQIANVGLRWAHALARARLEVDTGAAPPRVVEQMRPPVHFARKTAVVRMLSAWTSPRLREAARALDAAVLTTRRAPTLAEAALEETLLGLAALARAR